MIQDQTPERPRVDVRRGEDGVQVEVEAAGVQDVIVRAQGHRLVIDGQRPARTGISPVSEARPQAHQVLSRGASAGLQRRTRASTATQPSGPASTGFRSSSATSGWFSTRRAEPMQHVREGAASAAGAPAPARDEPSRLAARDSSSASTSVSGASASRRRADQLREHPARPERDERPEDRVLDRADEQLDACR